MDERNKSRKGYGDGKYEREDKSPYARGNKSGRGYAGADDIAREAVGRLFNDTVEVEGVRGRVAPAGQEEGGVKRGMDEYAAASEDDYEDDESYGDGEDYEDEEDESGEPYYKDSSSDYESYRSSLSRSARYEEDRKRSENERLAFERDAKLTEPIRDYKRSPTYGRSPARKYSQDYPGDEEAEIQPSIGPFGLSDIKFVLAGGVVVVLVILAFLVVKINTVNSQLRTATAQAAAYKQAKEDYDNLNIEKTELKRNYDEVTAKYAALEEEYNQLKASVAGGEGENQADNLEAQSPGEDGNNVSTPSPPPSNALSSGDATTNSSGQRVYTVKEGDTFWSIAKNFYGNGSKYPTIVEANKLNENTSLKEGMKLIIP